MASEIGKFATHNNQQIFDEYHDNWSKAGISKGWWLSIIDLETLVYRSIVTTVQSSLQLMGIPDPHIHPRLIEIEHFIPALMKLSISLDQIN